MLKWTQTKAEHKTIAAIAARAIQNAKASTGQTLDYRDLEMDVTAAHCNGCPLDLERLLAFDDFNFNHDVFGIRRHLNRETGELENHFVPRCATTAREVSI